ncbi:MAG TPA: hypothetical protein VL096_06355 [Pirellulaceae bacterium]|nr:hypothetical protein [Pirellulaceae bacterium]
MTKYEFTLILTGSPELTDDLCDALFAAGCDDATPSESCGVTKMVFHRVADSLEVAIRSAIANVEAAGCQVERLEMDNHALAETLKV